MNNQDLDRARLSDRILTALELSLEQDDIAVSEKLNDALELSLTRKAGGGEFVERRNYPPAIEKAVEKLAILKKKSKE